MKGSLDHTLRIFTLDSMSLLSKMEAVSIGILLVSRASRLVTHSQMNPGYYDLIITSISFKTLHFHPSVHVLKVW